MMRWHLSFIVCPLICVIQGKISLAEPTTPAVRHWSFRPLQSPPVPRNNSAWAKNSVDEFILHELKKQGLSPSPAADPLTLLRRVTFDLTGLPPTVAEIERYQREADQNSETAYSKLVDRLLDSSHYGERWAQHWLDVVRYAESNGYEGDGERPNSWRYRDYVVCSLNDDKPFDQFVSEQIAGDQLAAGKSERSHTDLWIATGMHRCGPMHVVSGNVDPEENRQEFLSEAVQGIGSAFLGLTVHCARCHDHKFDPIPQTDFYRLQAFFASARPKDVDFATPEERAAFQFKLIGTMAKLAPVKARLSALDAPFQSQIRELKRAKLDQRYRDALDAVKPTADQQNLAKEAQLLLKVSWDEIVTAMPTATRERRAALRAEQHALEAELPLPPSQAWAIADDGKDVATHLLIRGEVKKKGAKVVAGFPVALCPPAKEELRPLNRIDLARWLTAPEHPLTARVFVNRLWQHHFGKGIVHTPNDFGKRSASPTHPALLDWLASEFIRGGWKIKPMHRLMVMSNTYRQSSAADRTLDEENKWLSRMSRRRLDGEAIRDAILVASGSLNRQVGGPMIRVPLEPEVYDLIFTEGEPDGLWPVTADVQQHCRRSLYLFAKRNVRLPLLETFDQPDRLTPCGERAISTYAPQALILMNGPFARAESQKMACSLLRNSSEPEQWVKEAYLRCFGRKAAKNEVEQATDFLRIQIETISDRLRLRLPATLPEVLPDNADPATAAALADFCRALFNANEFVYVP